jgi:HAMP domain-containing protein
MPARNGTSTTTTPATDCHGVSHSTCNPSRRRGTTGADLDEQPYSRSNRRPDDPLIATVVYGHERVHLGNGQWQQRSGSSNRVIRWAHVPRTLVLALSILLVACPLQAAAQVGARTITIRLIATEDNAKRIVDRAPEYETGTGDVIVVTSFLRNAVAQFGRPKGAVVGGSAATFTVVTSTRADLSVEISLPGGTLWAGGRVRFGAVQTYSVTGGTGKFRHARGTGESRALGTSGNRRLNVYHLRLP